MWKKIAVLFITPLIAAIMAGIKFKPIEDYIKKLDPEAPIYLAIGIVILTLISQYITVISPFKKYEQWAKNKWYVLDNEVAKLIAKYSKDEKIDLSFNIMTKKIAGFYRINPKQAGSKEKKFTLVGNVFKTIWSNGNSNVHKQLRITTKQGVCGVAQRTGKLAVAEFVHEPIPNFNFSEDQKELVKDIQMIISFPISIKVGGAESQPTEVIGVLNVESSTLGSDVLITDRKKRDALAAELLAFSNICNKLI